MSSIKIKILKLLVILTLGLLPTNPAGAEDGFGFLFHDSSRYENVEVQNVISADTIIIENYLKRGEKIQLLGIKAPEPPEEESPTQKRDQYGFIIKEEVSPLISIEEKALQFAKDLLENKSVRIEFDTNKKNENNVTTGYVFLKDDGTFANAEIIRQGYAQLQIRPPNTKYAQELREAYREARNEKRGLQAAY